MGIVRQFNKYLKIRSKKEITSGYGAFEYLLAAQRASLANKFIADVGANSKVLDIGCGSYPIFLLTSRFIEKIGIEKATDVNSAASRKFKLINYDIEQEINHLPFDDNSINVITMLAVLEHIRSSKITGIISEIRRILTPGGICIITVPSTWTYYLLYPMAKIGLVRKAEVADHKSNLSSLELSDIIKKAGFKEFKSGYFELFMNRFFVAKK